MMPVRVGIFHHVHRHDRYGFLYLYNQQRLRLIGCYTFSIESIAMIRNIRLDLEYDGRNYCGWQWQPELPSIEKTVKEAIEKIIGHPIILYSSGRTDAGVHAEQHVAHFFTENTLPADILLKAINAVLPNDIAVYRVVEMPETWSARYDALEREYRYTFFQSDIPSVFFQHWTYWVKAKTLDISAMRQAAPCFEGKHDFSAFRSLHCDAEHPIRTILECRLIDDLPLIHLKVSGHAFLRHQVRTMAGTILYIGLGKLPPDAIGEILQSKDRTKAGPTLAAHALTLVSIRYKEDDFCQIASNRLKRFDLR